MIATTSYAADADSSISIVTSNIDTSMLDNGESSSISAGTSFTKKLSVSNGYVPKKPYVQLSVLYCAVGVSS